MEKEKMKIKKIKLKSGKQILSATIYRKDQINAPLVIFCHGLGSSQNSRKIKKFILKLMKKGINSFTFDFAHHGKSTGNFEKLTVKQSLHDLKTIIQYVRKLKFVSNVSIIASSYGGLIASTLAQKYPELRTLVLLAPLTYFKSKYNMTHDIVLWKKKGYEERKLDRLNYSYYKSGIKYNSIKNACKIKAATLIIHGDKDTVVPISQSKKFYKELNCKKKIYIVKGADHDWVGYLDSVVNKSVRWIVDYTK
jgi:alpha-beta hydrolase superfamily lysophospholipase